MMRILLDTDVILDLMLDRPGTDATALCLCVIGSPIYLLHR